MLKFYTKMKHWQVFLVLCILLVMPTILVMIGFNYTGDRPEILMLTNFISLFVSLCVFYAWLWAMGNNLHSKLPAEITMDLRIFRIIVIFAFIWSLVRQILPMYETKFLDDLNIEIHGFPVGGIIMLGRLVSLVCLFYCFWFIAKAMKSAEDQEKVSFGDFAGEFFLLWLFPIGIWLIQPRINKLFTI